MKNQNKNTIIIYMTLVLVTSLPTAAFSNEINFFRLFFQTQPPNQINNYSLVAHYFSDDRSFFIARNKQNDALQILEMNKPTNFEPLMLVANKFDGEKLFLHDSNNKKYFVSFEDVRSSTISIPPSSQSNNNESWSGKDFTKDVAPLSKLQSIANMVGVPKFITSKFNELPKPGRTFGGRPGWLIDETVPKLFLLSSPFKTGDLIVTIDGVNTHRLQELQKHLEEKASSEYFDVEIQRNGKMMMLRIRL
jgi:hypothetical protein